jgi:hypothetical protein
MSVDSHALLALSTPSSTHNTDINTAAASAVGDDLHEAWMTYSAFNWLVYSIKCTPPEREEAMLWWENEALIIRRLRQIERNKQGRGRVGSAAPTRTLTDIHGRKMLGAKHHRAGADGLLPGKRGSAQYLVWLESTEIPLLALLVGLESTLHRTTNATTQVNAIETLKKECSSNPLVSNTVLPTHFLRQGFKRFTSSSPWYHIQFEVAAQLHPGSSGHNTSTSSSKSSPSAADLCPRLLGGTAHLFTDATTSTAQVSPPAGTATTLHHHTGGNAISSGQLTSKELRLEALNGGFVSTGLAVHTFHDYCQHLISSPAATTAFLGLAMPMMVKRPIPPLRQKRSGSKKKPGL